MILSDLLGQPVLAEERVGFVTDVRFLLHEDADGTAGQAALYGLVISPRARASYLGYERSAVRAPWPIAAFQRYHHRASFLVEWGDITGVDEDGVHLRSGYRRRSPRLP